MMCLFESLRLICSPSVQTHSGDRDENQNGTDVRCRFGCQPEDHDLKKVCVYNI